MFTSNKFRLRLFPVCFMLLIVLPMGCSPAQQSETISLIQQALNDLNQNRTVAEQYVRDIKSHVSPSDAGYARARDSYEEALMATNHFIDTAESSAKSREIRSLDVAVAEDAARDAIANFFSDATVALKPDMSTRRIPFVKAVTIPKDLDRSINRLRAKDRDVMIHNVDPDIRWRSWGAV